MKHRRVSNTIATILGEGRREDLNLPPKKKDAAGNDSHKNRFKNARDTRRAALDLPARKPGMKNEKKKKVAEARFPAGDPNDPPNRGPKQYEVKIFEDGVCIDHSGVTEEEAIAVQRLLHPPRQDPADRNAGR